MKSGEAEAASVLDESENKAEKPVLFQSWCHLTMVPENNWVKLQKKQVCWKDAWMSTNVPQISKNLWRWWRKIVKGQTIWPVPRISGQ